VTSPDWLVAWAGDEQSAVLEVTASGTSADAVGAHVPALVLDRVASRIAAHDATLWGAEAESEASIRLGWTDVFEASRRVAEQALALRDELAAEGVTRVVLCGMGGSSLAPEVITKTAGVPLVVLDGTDPSQVRGALEGDLTATVVVVSSKSGSTVETDSQRRVFEAAFTAAGIDAASRIVVVTDPGSPLEKASLAAGYRAVVNADPNVGGRFSGLTAFGIVPSALAGVDVLALLDDAEAVADLLCDDAEGNPALVLGSAIAGTSPLRDKLVFVDDASGMVGFPDWVEQLIAESTGKDGKGLLPVVVDGEHSPEVSDPDGDVLVIRLVAPSDTAEDSDAPSPVAPLPTEVTVSGPLGAQLLLWEYATAVAGRLLDLNPFDQPDVESAKTAARGLLDATPAPSPAQLVDGAVELRATPGLLDGVSDLPGALRALLGQLTSTGYVAVMAYLDRERDTELTTVRDRLAAVSHRPVTFGWGPRFLHSTGQYHKGGPAVGVYLQVTSIAGEDLPIPERPFSFGQLVSAQAAGDAQVLADNDRPVLRVHLTDRAAGLSQLVTAVAGLAASQVQL
jgi:glucose-6-phosphate isomerase